MSDRDPDSVEAIFIELMAGRGYKRRAMNWYIDSGEVVAGVNLQTSKYNDRKHWGLHYVNAGCFVRDLDVAQIYATRLPPYYYFHVRLRVGDETDPTGNRVHCLDDNLAMTTLERRQAIGALIDGKISPLVQQLSTADGVVLAYTNRQLADHHFGKPLTDWIMARHAANRAKG